MSCVIKHSKLSDEACSKIDKELFIKMEENKYSFAPPETIYPHSVVGNDVCIPFAYAYRELKLKRPAREEYPQTCNNFAFDLYPEQKEFRKESLDLLNKKGSVLLSAFTGAGKTATAISLATMLRFKTLVIVHKVILMKQWEEEIRKFVPDARVQQLTAQSKIRDCDFFIMNAQNVPKMGVSAFKDIGLLIVDECHLIMAKTLSKSMQYIRPRYLIGLSATPYRPDGLNGLLDFYFGKHKVVRELKREHLVYKVDTGFSPKVEKTKQNTTNWGVLLNSQGNDVPRNELIIRIIKHFSDRVFIVITKRKEQAYYLMKRLGEEDVYATDLVGSKQEFDRDARVLVGICGKLGTGFDHKRLDAFILAADVEEFYIQVLGRVFRTKEVVPLVFDLVDNNHSLRKHWETRKRVYTNALGTIKNFNKEFPHLMVE